MGSACYYCGTNRDTRPYGPGGSGLCFDCMKADPDRERVAGEALAVQIEAAAAMSPTGMVMLDAASGEIGPVAGDRGTGG